MTSNPMEALEAMALASLQAAAVADVGATVTESTTAAIAGNALDDAFHYWDHTSSSACCTISNPNIAEAMNQPSKSVERIHKLSEDVTEFTVPAMASSLITNSQVYSSVQERRRVESSKASLKHQRKRTKQEIKKHKRTEDTERKRSSNRYRRDEHRRDDKDGRRDTNRGITTTIESSHEDEVLDEAETPIGRMMKHREHLLEKYSHLFTSEKRYQRGM